MLLLTVYLVNKQGAGNLGAAVLRVDHRDASAGRSVIYCLNSPQSGVILLQQRG